MHNKNQHYVPQVYLRRFCRNEKLWVYDKKKNSYWNQPPKEVTKKTHYYSFKNEDGSHDLTLENLFSRIENASKNIFDKIDRNEVLDSIDKSILATFIGFQYVRVPSFKDNTADFIEKVASKINIVAFGNEEHAKQSLLNIGKEEEEITDEMVKKMVEFVNSGDYTLEINKNYLNETMFNIGNDLPKYFNSMLWNLHISNQKHSFLTSDNPLTIIDPIDFPKHPLIKAGLLTPGALKLFPLGNSLCLVMGDRGTNINYISIPPKVIRWLNRRTFLNATRYVMGRDKALIERIVKDIKNTGSFS